MESRYRYDVDGYEVLLEVLWCTSIGGGAYIALVLALYSDPQPVVSRNYYPWPENQN